MTSTMRLVPLPAKLAAAWTAALLLALPAAMIAACSSTHSAPPPTPGATQQPAAAAWPDVSLSRVVTGLTRPTSLTGAGDGSGRIFITEQAGRVRILRNGALVPTPFLDISSLVLSTGSEQGLLSVAFPPNFAAKGYFYVDYTAVAGNGDTVIARYHVSATNPDRADPASAEVLLTIDQPYPNHNGGQLAFGPDGRLYIGMGDGGSGGDPQRNGQNRTSLLGKILRLDVETGPGPYTPEIWGLGLRNPWRFSFDTNGDLYIADVGQNQYEEVDYVAAGAGAGLNFGWNVTEGFHCYNASTCNTAGFTMPIAEYDHSLGCSVTGGYVYRGSRYAALRDIYFYADYCSGRLWGLQPDRGSWASSLLKETGLSVTSFGQDDDHNLYLLDYRGAVYELSGTAGTPSTLPGRTRLPLVSRD